MPQTRSAKKRLRQDARRRLRNRRVSSAVKTQMKKVSAAAEEKDGARAKAELAAAYKKLDQAARKGVIHRNAASRHKSRLAKKIEGLNGEAGAANATE